MLKIAVIGTGFIASVHAKNVARHPGTELVAAAIGEAGDVDTSIISIRMASGALGQIADKATECLKTGRPVKSFLELTKWQLQ
jgi:hypothetical protein